MRHREAIKTRGRVIRKREWVSISRPIKCRTGGRRRRKDVDRGKGGISAGRKCGVATQGKFSGEKDRRFV